MLFSSVQVPSLYDLPQTQKVWKSLILLSPPRGDDEVVFSEVVSLLLWKGGSKESHAIMLCGCICGQVTMCLRS